MKHYKLLIAATMIASLSFYTQTANAGVLSDSLKNRLRDVSAVMSDEGNIHFICVELMNDGLIKDYQSIDLNIDSTGISLNNIFLPEPYQAKYTQLLENFYRPQPKRHHYTRLQYGPGPSIAQMLDPKSDFRKPEIRYDFDPEKFEAEKRSSDLLVDEMLKDGLLDSLHAIRIVYNSKGITVNGKLLTGEAERKYINFYKEHYGFVMDKKTNSMSLRQDALYLHANDKKPADIR